MQDQNQQVRDDHGHRMERAIVLQVLRDDHDELLSRTALEATLEHIEQRAIDGALAHLQDEGVIELAGEAIRPSRAARRLDELEMLAI